MVAVSTCYWSEELTDPEAMVTDILDSGFESIELEYRISESQFQKIKPIIKKKLFVSSIHNYFPKPDDPNIKGSGDLFLLSSTDKDEHTTAIKYTLRTMEYANEMEAKAVVLHLGKVDMENPFEEFKKLFELGKITQNEGKKFIEEQTKIRNSLRQKNLDAVLKALDKLVIPAEKYGIFLGIENRFYFHEIPNLEEAKVILQEFKGSNIRYWYDVGHAVVQERLGICSQKNLIINFLDAMIGIHIHDVKGIEDHLAPGEGELDLLNMLRDIKKDVIKVLEVHKNAKKENLIKAKNMF